MEDYLDRDILGTRSSDGVERDIFDAPELRSFCGPDGKLFLERPGNEARLIFALNMDGFNPFQGKEAGKKGSVGGIYMVCLNLPPEIRHDIENMYCVGIIPGPHEPSLDQINHFLRLLVDELEEFDDPGVFYNRTAKYPKGRVVRCVVIPLVCDLPAARQMAGFSSHAALTFCSLCKLSLRDTDDLNHTCWERKTGEEHRHYAQQWRDAENEEIRTKIFNDHGVRWSELLRLWYWDPVKYTVIDSMHAFSLGALCRLVRKVWGMDINFADGPGISWDRKGTIPSDEEMYNARIVLEFGTQSELQALLWPVLRELCLTCGERFGGKRKKLLKSLYAYVS